MSSHPAPKIRLSRASTSVSDDDQQTFHDRSEVTATEAELWAAMTPEHLMMLRRYFIQPKGWSRRASLSVAGEDEEETRILSRPQFIDAFTGVLDTERFESVCGIIFDAIAASSPSAASTTTSSGFTGAHISSSSSNISSSSSSLGGSTATLGIGWAALITHLAEGVGGAGVRDVSPDHLFAPTPKYSLLTHNKREGVAGVTVCGRKRILIVGTRGSLTKTTARSRHHHQKHHGRLYLDSSPEDTSQTLANSSRKTSLGTWIVEVAMVEEETAVMAASSSNLHFVDTSGTVPQEILRVTHLPALPTSIAAGCDSKGRWVSIGDDLGAAHLIRFPQPVVTLMTRSRNEGLTVLTWQEMCSGYQEINGRVMEVCQGVRVVSVPIIHSGSVRQVTYHPPSSALVSCSSDPKASLVIRTPDHNTKTYTFAIPKGVRVFSVEWHLHIIVTGSSDGRLRVWNPYVPEAPMAALPPSPSRAPPAAVSIWAPTRTIVTCDADGVVRVYSLEGNRCVQTLKLNFPGGCTGMGTRPLTLLPTGQLIVACRDYLATLMPAPRSQISQQQSRPSDLLSARSDVSSDGESDVGQQESDREGNRFQRSDEDDEDDLDEEEESEGEDEKIFKDATLLSAEEKRDRLHMRRFIRQGATFCCLSPYKVTPPTLPVDLPLPSRLANLGLTPSDTSAILMHLPVSLQNNVNSMATPRSAPNSARAPSSRVSPMSPRALSRPSSPRRRSALQSARPGVTPDNQTDILGSRKHLSPGWRPQQSNRK